MKYCFIINPASGKSATKEGLENRIAEECAAAEVECDILYTERAGDAQRYIAELRDKYPDEDIRIYACGGDGTLNEAVNGIMALDDRSGVSLGVLPVGTGNDFVRSFEKSSLFLDISAQIEAQPLDIDLIKCNDFYAVNMINIGFDCQVVVKTAEFKHSRFIPSKLAYICGLVATLIKKPGVNMDMSIDGEMPTARKLLLTTFAKGQFCGGGFHSNPYADLGDGIIDSIVVNNVSRTRFLSLVGSYKKGTHICEKNARILKNIRASAYKMMFDRPTEISVDGEIVKVDRIDMSCAKGALRFLVPKGAEALCALNKIKETSPVL